VASEITKRKTVIIMGFFDKRQETASEKLTKPHFYIADSDAKISWNN